MRVPKHTAAALVLLFAIPNVFGQSEPAQTAPATDHSAETSTAAIYVTALTKKGLLVQDLKPEDIAITEEKVPAKIEKVDCHKSEPLLIGVLVDVSGSRRSDSHLRSHYDDLEAFLNKLLTREDGTYLVAYGDKVRKLSEVVTDSSGISAAFKKLREQQPLGSTALYDAIMAAARANFKGRAGHRILVVIGDWEDNSSRVRSDEALKAAQQTSTTIYAILDADNGVEGKKSHRRAVEVAKELAEQTGGFAYEVRDKNDFAQILQGIGGAVVSACKVTYTTSENPDAKKGAKLHVQANSKDVSISYPSVRFSSSQ